VLVTQQIAATDTFRAETKEWKMRRLGPMTLHVAANRMYMLHVPLLSDLLDTLLFVTCGARVPHQDAIGENSILGHGGSGIFIHPQARMGRNVVIGQQVTIGGTGKSGKLPIIEDDVILGAGSKILGNVTVGRNSVVGANAVVTKSVPPFCVVAGVPARILREGVNSHDVETW
jgi:serine O-acetyltransferase